MPALLERDGELAAIDDLIGATADGGRLAVIEGPPGIGKTSLIVEAKARAQRAGMQVLAGRGSDLARILLRCRQAALRTVSRPADRGRAGRAARRRSCARDAARSCAPRRRAPSGRVLREAAWLFWLTANVAARRPLLLAVDDLHWCDTASLRWLGYLLPRIEGLPVLLVVGLRPSEPGEDAPHRAGRLRSAGHGASAGSLGNDATAQLVRATLSADADDVFCSACQEETGGNPLLLRELVSRIAAEGLAPTAANVPVCVSSRHEPAPAPSRFALPGSRRRRRRPGRCHSRR